ncbi:MAG: type II toxin-antitoxin system HicB family antitoxin [Bacteroidetes bacterium]|nr:type II toxin-antitoxin system HicB family antitoxin [Bacteroidota bacterium]
MESLLMKTIKYVVYKEGKHYVSQCLNVDISSFGSSVQEAVDNLNEALELYFEDGDALKSYPPIKETLVGESRIRV